MMKRIVSLLAVLAMVALAAAPALAQAQGPGDPELHGPPHANSICSFSGLNDEPDLPAPEGGRTQNYGQLVRQGAADPSAQPGPAEPGVFCNAHNFPLQGGGGPPE